MGEMYDLEQIVENHLYRKGMEFRAINFGRVKCKPRDMSWDPDSVGGKKQSPVRVVKMENNSSQQGQGNISVTKEAKPICTFELNAGILKGFPHSVTFKMPYGSPLQHFQARVDGDSPKQVLDNIELQLDSTVPLNGSSTVYSHVKNESNDYHGEFSCEAELSGKVVVIKNDGGTSDIDIRNIAEFPRSVEMQGSLEIVFQDTQKLLLDTRR